MTLGNSLDHVFRQVGRLSNDELEAQLVALVQRDRYVTAELLVHLGEVDARRLHVCWAFSSLFRYTVGSLGFSEDEAYRRITGARVVRKFPAALGLVAGGSLHLSGLLVVAPYLTATNHLELLGAACDKTKRQVEKLVAERFPRPDVPASVRKLPAVSPETAGTNLIARDAASDSITATELARSAPATEASACVVPDGAHGQGPTGRAVFASNTADFNTDAPSLPVLRPSVEAKTMVERTPRPSSMANAASATTVLSSSDLLPERPLSRNDGEARPMHGLPASTPTRPADRPRIEPLAPSRYRVTFTASSELVEKLERAQELASHAVSPSDLAAVFERALDALIAREQKRRYAARPQPSASGDERQRVSLLQPLAEPAPRRARGRQRASLQNASAEPAPKRVAGAAGASSDNMAELAPERVHGRQRSPVLQPTTELPPQTPERVDGPRRTSVTERPPRFAPERVGATAGAPTDPAADRLPCNGRQSRYVPAHVRRSVCERDGGRCTFVDPATGRRCNERHFLELDHVEPHALGGPATVDNLRITCRVHNALLARRAYGEQYVQATIARSQRRPTADSRD